MNDRFADLHIHSNFSDGTSSPFEVVSQASLIGLTCIAVTDHDTVDGLAETFAAAESARIEVLSGIELSSEYKGKDIHILGYCFKLQGSVLVERLCGMQQARVERMKKMIAKLHDLKIKDISLEDVAGMTRSDALGRLHLAKLLVLRGHVRSLDEAFEKYLAEGAAAYFPKFKQTPFEAIKLIRDSGGVAVMAHPVLTQRDGLIPELVAAGLGGIEAYYPNCPMDTVNRYLDLARKYDLVVTGGSDAHGDAKTSTFIGKSYVPYHWVEKLKERVQA